MTRKEYLGALDSLKQWAAALRDLAEEHTKKLRIDDGAEVPDAGFEPLRAAARDHRFLAFAPMLTPQAAKPDPIGFSDFISNISRSFVDAQKRLDSESAAYLKSIEDRAHVQPAVFQMPRVTANMRFALEVSKSTGFNLLFFDKKEESTTRNEQSIEFEVVSVPAPPEAMRAVGSLAPRLALTMDPAVRRAVLARIAEETPGRLSDPLIEAARKTPDRVLILESSPAPEPRWLALHATRESANSVGMWRITKDGIETIYSFSRNNGPGEVNLVELVSALADRQEAFLK